MHEKITCQFISNIRKKIEAEMVALPFLPQEVINTMSRTLNTVRMIEYEIKMLETLGIKPEEINTLIGELRNKAYQQAGSNMAFIITGLKEYRTKISKQK